MLINSSFYLKLLPGIQTILFQPKNFKIKFIFSQIAIYLFVGD